MERENMPSISQVADYFDPILPSGQKIWMDFGSSPVSAVATALRR